MAAKNGCRREQKGERRLLVVFVGGGQPSLAADENKGAT
jgi:hypothetical protein